ncbi:MAG: Flp pilus assembly complex ATPase component TadA [Gemmatimonadaceae bacterium]|nr:Flp pilus assembly complex ATPase component TadA [Gemmatimonadaceae bacterium]
MTEPDSKASREARIPWTDRWLLDAMRQQGHKAADQLKPAASAWEALEAAGATTAELTEVACALSGASPAHLEGVSRETAHLLAPHLAQRYGVIPVREEGPVLEVATSNPLVPHLERDLSFASARQVRITVCSPAAQRAASQKIYGGRPSQAVQAPSRLEWIVKEGPTGRRTLPNRGAVVDSLDRLIADALDQRASDVHFEPKDDELLVRYRVDGVLHDVTRVSADVAPLLMSRLKILAGLDIADRRRPQDGRASTRFDGRDVDLRVSTLPLGDRYEKAVVRLLDAHSATRGLDALGFMPSETHRVSQLLGANEGMVLVTGPTGSGKTTTLYSALEQCRTGETNIVTVEDPIEYHLEGINQVQVNEKAGLDFATALRSIVRQDPDVILVGEIRDAETAGIAVKAGLTGHLVLSTLHTIDAPSAIGRLADIGVDMGALSGALKGVVAQRLVRRLCDACARPIELADLPVTQQMLMIGRKTEKLRCAVGCDACRGTGYRGRMVVAEVLLVSDDLRSAIARREDRVELVNLAKRAGMIPMWEAGLRRVVEGLTSVQELIDNVPAPVEEQSSDQSDVDAVVARMLGRPAPAAAPAAASARPAAGGTHPAFAMPIPAASGAAAEGAPPVPSVRYTRIGPRPARPLPQDAPRALVVHEVREERRAWRDALENAGIAVVEAADGAAALAYARRLRPSVVVTDLVLPALDGFALVQALAGDGGAPCVACTEQQDPAMLAWAGEVGFRAIVPAHAAGLLLATAVREALAPAAAPAVRRAG